MSQKVSFPEVSCSSWAYVALFIFSRWCCLICLRWLIDQTAWFKQYQAHKALFLSICFAPVLLQSLVPKGLLAAHRCELTCAALHGHS